MNTQLQSLKKQVDQWRKSRGPNRQGPVPKHLKSQVMSLLGEYSAGYLTELLGFGSTTIYKWKNALLKMDVESVELLEVKPSAPMIDWSSAPLQITIKRDNLDIEVSMNAQQFQALILGTGGLS